MSDMNAYCDGFHRRDMLRIGMAGLFGTGLPLADILSRQAPYLHPHQAVSVPPSANLKSFDLH